MLNISEKLYSVEDLWELISQSEDYKFAELINGELVVAGGSGGQSTVIGGFMLRKIGNFVDDHKLGYVTGADGHYVFSVENNVAVIPDVAFVSKDNMPQPVPAKFLHIIPNLVIEVISPTDRANDIRKKIEIYLDYGTELIWIIYPQSKRIDVYRQSDKTHTETLSIDDKLSGETVLSGFELSVKDIFDSVE